MIICTWTSLPFLSPSPFLFLCVFVYLPVWLYVYIQNITLVGWYRRRPTWSGPWTSWRTSASPTLISLPRSQTGQLVADTALSSGGPGIDDENFGINLMISGWGRPECVQWDTEKFRVAPNLTEHFRPGEGLKLAHCFPSRVLYEFNFRPIYF